MPSSRTSALFTREVGNLRWWPAALHQVAWVVVLAIAATVTPSVTRAQDAGWTQLEPIGRYGQAMCFDSVRARTVMFGGTTPLSTFGTTDNNETWEWNGAAWTSRGQGGPTARRFAAMAYDSVRHVSVLFGGYYLNSANDVQLVSSDTWEWDGSTWTQRAVAGPSPRYAHAMVYDSSRQVMVLFGGRDAANNAFSDTWEWNGTSWSQRVVTGPETRYAHAMAFDPIRNVTVLYGGYDPNFGATLSDTWEWNGTAWTRRTVTGPGGRNGAGMAFDAASSSVLLFGGAFSGGETWGWNGTAWSRRATTGPAERSNIPLALDTS